MSLFVRFPPQLRPYIETPLVANYPDIAMERVGEEALDPPSEHGQWSVTVRLKPDRFPIKRPEECEESDPIASLLATPAAGNNDPAISWLQLRVQPLPSLCLRVWMAKHLVRVLDRPLFRSHDLLADLFSRCRAVS